MIKRITVDLAKSVYQIAGSECLGLCRSGESAEAAEPNGVWTICT